MIAFIKIFILIFVFLRFIQLKNLARILLVFFFNRSIILEMVTFNTTDPVVRHITDI